MLILEIASLMKTIKLFFHSHFSDIILTERIVMSYSHHFEEFLKRNIFTNY
jgi:hypothetical protein